MRWAVMGGGAVLAIALALGFYVWAELNGVFLPKRSFADLKDELRPHIQVHRPEGAGPFPTVVSFHGCGGPRRVQGLYAERAKDEGVMTVVIDSITPRGLSYEDAIAEVCSGRRLRGAERAGDVLAGLDLARDVEGVDPARLAAIGWSHGGWSIMDALAFDLPRQKPHGLSDVPGEPFAGVRGIALIYPFASFPSLTPTRGWSTTDIPVSVLLVREDATADAANARAAFAKAQADGARISIEEYEGVTHAFDEDDHHPQSSYEYDPDATFRVLELFGDWLQRSFPDDA